MDKNTEMYCAFVKGNKGQFVFPFEFKPSSIKSIQDDGVQVVPLEGEFVRTDTMKLYGINVQGNTKTWLLLSPLEPKIAKEMRDKGFVIDEIVVEKVEGDYETTLLFDKKAEDKADKKTKSKGKVKGVDI